MLGKILYFIPMWIVMLACIVFMHGETGGGGGFASKTMRGAGVNTEMVCEDPLYFKQTCDASTLISEFSKRKCCELNCVGKLLKMEVDKTAVPCCNLHQNLYCQPINSPVGDYFTRTVQAARTVTKSVRVTTRDLYDNDKERLTEKKTAWRIFIQDYFDQHKIPNGSGNYIWLYELFDADYNRQKVCRSAWMGVYGCTYNDLRKAQQNVRDNKMVGTPTYSTSLPSKFMKDVFKEFALDYDFYLCHMDSFARLKEVIQTLPHMYPIHYFIAPKPTNHSIIPNICSGPRNRRIDGCSLVVNKLVRYKW